MESFCRCFTNKLPTNQAQYFSICHPFLGDYVRLRQNPQWKKMCSDTNDQYVVFADIINKITRTGGKVMVHKQWLCHVHILDSPSSFSALKKNPVDYIHFLLAMMRLTLSYNKHLTFSPRQHKFYLYFKDTTFTSVFNFSLYQYFLWYPRVQCWYLTRGQCKSNTG